MSATTTATLPQTGTWSIDASHSSVEFVVRHLMVSKTKGRFTAFTGEVHIEEDTLKSWVSADVDLASVDTHDEGRDTHLRSGDFFDVEQHPKMSFRSTSLTAKSDDEYVLAGELGIKGVTRAVSFDLEFNGASGDPWGGQRAGFTATAEISRKDFGLEWNMALETGGVVVGDKVKITLEVEIVKQ